MRRNSIAHRENQRFYSGWLSTSPTFQDDAHACHHLLILLRVLVHDGTDQLIDRVHDVPWFRRATLNTLNIAFLVNNKGTGNNKPTNGSSTLSAKGCSIIFSTTTNHVVIQCSQLQQATDRSLSAKVLRNPRVAAHSSRPSSSDCRTNRPTAFPSFWTFPGISE